MAARNSKACHWREDVRSSPTPARIESERRNCLGVFIGFGWSGKTIWSGTCVDDALARRLEFVRGRTWPETRLGAATGDSGNQERLMGARVETKRACRWIRVRLDGVL